jgi:Alkylmercury lyase
MLLFRSEDDVEAWCAQRHIVRGVAFDLARLWRLACAWYDDRLDPDWRRRTVRERQAVLESVGLDGPFWRLSD